MKSPFNFIVRPHNGRRYDNIKSIGGIDFITSTSQEDHTVSNRYATVISTPIDYNGEIEEGDTLVVHHNVFKYYNDMQGRQKSGKSFFMDDLFLIDDYQYYLYKHNDVWKAVDMFCFVKPIPKEDYYLHSAGTEQPLMGVIEYTNNVLISCGINVGDVVSFLPDSEYEFTIEGKKLYRVLTDSITMKL
jgi:hypothetical protein